MLVHRDNTIITKSINMPPKSEHVKKVFDGCVEEAETDAEEVVSDADEHWKTDKEEVFRRLGNQIQEALTYFDKEEVDEHVKSWIKDIYEQENEKKETRKRK